MVNTEPPLSLLQGSWEALRKTSQHRPSYTTYADDLLCLGSCIVVICKVGIVCQLPSRVMELVVTYINHPEVVLVGRSMLRDWSLPLSIFPFPVLSSAHDSIPTSHRWISLWSSLSQTNIIKVKMVRGTVAFGFIIVKTIWPRCLGEYYMCINTHTHTKPSSSDSGFYPTWQTLWALPSSQSYDTFYPPS